MNVKKIKNECKPVTADNVRALAAALRDAGLVVFPPDGGYFLVADVSALGMTSAEYCR